MLSTKKKACKKAGKKKAARKKVAKRSVKKIEDIDVSEEFALSLVCESLEEPVIEQLETLRVDFELDLSELHAEIQDATLELINKFQEKFTDRFKGLVSKLEVVTESVQKREGNLEDRRIEEEYQARKKARGQ